MIICFEKEDLDVVMAITGRLGTGWSFRYTKYLHGIQCNWKKDGVSIMWRSVDCDRKSVERYEPSKSIHPEIIDIEEL